MNTHSALVLGLSTLFAATTVEAQGVVVDEGQFEVTINGRNAGSEDFVIRRAGIGLDGAIFANGAVVLDTQAGHQEVRPLLQVAGGTASAYQVSVTGADAMELRLNRVRERYIATISSEIGEEDREFQARVETQVLETGVAHHYYFLRDLREGRSAHALEPRSRRQLDLVAGEHIDEELQVGRNVVEARRVEFSAGEDRRVVWFDRQGRVLRVEIPDIRYVAERTDLVG